MAAPVAIVFGAGANIGTAVSRRFTQEGYKVAGVARNPKDDLANVTAKAIAADLSKPEEVARVFEEVKKDLGYPSIVVYNAYAITPADASDVLKIPVDAFANDIAVNTTSAYAAALAAVTAFAKLAEAGSTYNRVFIYTGSMYSSIIVPEGLTLGTGKVATAYVVETAAHVYGKEGAGEKGFWYFADERFEGGQPMMNFIDGKAHAEHLWTLTNLRCQGPWNQTFVKGKGYVSFPDTVPDKKVVGLQDFFDKAAEASEKRESTNSGSI